MLKSGLVSVTYRGFSCEEIIDLACENGLSGIEWGADVHVKPGDLTRAAEVLKCSEAVGIDAVSYGSYWRAGDRQENFVEFERVLASAEALHAPNIRIWAGTLGSEESDDENFERVVFAAQKACDLARLEGMTVSFEYHPQTLTDNANSALRLVEAVGRENLRLYWQPNFTMTQEENLASLRAVLPYVSHVHVFYWDADYRRFPLKDGAAFWKKCVGILRSTGREHDLLLEFVQGDAASALESDAHTLHSLLGENS